MKEISINLKFDDELFKKIKQILEHEKISMDNLFIDIITNYIQKNRVFYSSKFDGLWTIDGTNKSYLFEGNTWTEIGEKGKNRIKGIFTYNEKTIILTTTHKYNSLSDEWWDGYAIKEKIKYKLDNNTLVIYKKGKDEEEYKKSPQTLTL